MGSLWNISPEDIEDIIKAANHAVTEMQKVKKNKSATLGPSIVDWAAAEKVYFDEPTKQPNTFTTGTGQVLKWVHNETPECAELGCVIHHPTDPHQDWPTHWQHGVMWRKCPCGELHPDQDHVNFVSRTQGYTEWMHSCPCRCCEGPKVEGHAADLMRAKGLVQ